MANHVLNPVEPSAGGAILTASFISPAAGDTFDVQTNNREVVLLLGINAGGVITFPTTARIDADDAGQGGLVPPARVVPALGLGYVYVAIDPAVHGKTVHASVVGAGCSAFAFFKHS
jgi:hypothetical protein